MSGALPAQPPGLPAGTVTLLFSDIEASTAMVHALGDDWARVLEQQRRLCRRAWSRHGGHELATEGDSFMVVFTSPRDAVAAGLRVQASMAAATWPEGTRVRLRVGLHTGTPTRHADGYVGMDVHRAARVASAAHGGQLLVSEPTMRLVADRLPDSVVVRDLGEHQLKDIPTRTRLFQVSQAGVGTDFPPLRTLGGTGSLPTALRDGLREVVGRDGEIARVVDLLADGVRLVTLTGPGGVGKSTLATSVGAAAGDRFSDGVFVVPLAGVTTVAGTWAALSQVLDAPPDAQVPPAFFDHVRHRRVLLLLDNLEQIADADRVVADLLAEAPGVSVVATSRRPLHLAGEREHAVPGLDPADAEALFGERAARARRGFVVDDANRAAVRELCAALDRLPLAIEIVAARVKVLSPQAMLSRLDSSLDLASGQRLRDGRQATLGVTIAWSYDLLDRTRRTVLDHLGVFVGGAPLDAVEAVVGPEALDGEDLIDVLFDLVDQSMVVASDTDDGEPRFHLLETVRRFALARLEESGGRPAAEQRHGQHYLDLVRSLDHEPSSPRYRAARAVFLVELSNVDAVLARPGLDLSWERRVMPAAHRCALVAMVALQFRLVEDSRLWARTGLDRVGDPFARSWLASVVARTELNHGSAERALEVAADALATVAGPTDPLPWRSSLEVEADLLYVATVASLDLEDQSSAETWCTRLRSLTASADDVSLTVVALSAAFLVAEGRGDLGAAREHLLEWEAVHRAHDLGADHRIQNNLADIDLGLGRTDRAHDRLAAHAEAVLESGDPSIRVVYCETTAAVVAHEHPQLCVRTYAAAAVFRVAEGIGNDEYGAAEDERVLAGVRPLLTPDEWDAAWRRGTTESLPDLLREMAVLPTVGPGPGGAQ